MDELSYIQNQINQNNSWSAEQAQKQMDFQERMSNTAHQREIADLKAAGLNPVLSAKLGGASTPSGSLANPDNSAVNALVELMTKVLDIESDNAKANLVRSSSGSGISNYNSTSAEGLTGTDVQGLAAIAGIPIVSSAADFIASAYNGFTDKDDNAKNKSTTTYNTTKNLRHFAEDNIRKANDLVVKDESNTNSTGIKGVVSKMIQGNAKVVKEFVNAGKKIISKFKK